MIGKNIMNIKSVLLVSLFLSLFCSSVRAENPDNNTIVNTNGNGNTYFLESDCYVPKPEFQEGRVFIPLNQGSAETICEQIIKGQINILKEEQIKQIQEIDDLKSEWLKLKEKDIN